MRKLISSILLVTCLVATVFIPDADARRARRVHREIAASAILIDVDHNRRYFGKDIERLVYPASTTKVLTAIVVLDKLPLNQLVTVSNVVEGIEPTKIDLKPGEQYTVRDLLYGLLLKSANDAAAVLAEAVAGSQDKFVALMNDKAVQLGAVHSHFANPHGLPSQAKQYTTAYDMALIFRAALKNDFFQNVIMKKYKVIYSKAGRRIFLKSHNKSLFLDWKRPVYGKTGYTRQAGSCFVGFVRKGNDTLVISVFGSRKRWDVTKLILERYGKIDL